MEITKTVFNAAESLRGTTFSDDIVQDFYEYWLNLDNATFENDEKIKRFVHQKMKFLSWNETKVECNRRRLEMEAGMTSAEPETADDPLDLLIFEEELRETLKGFSDLIRETMHQYYVLGWSPQEIADCNLEGVEAVRKRITRGRDLWQNFHTCEN